MKSNNFSNSIKTTITNDLINVLCLLKQIDILSFITNEEIEKHRISKK